MITGTGFIVLSLASGKTESGSLSTFYTSNIMHSDSTDNRIAREATITTIGKSAKQRPINAYYFPGTGKKTALIIAGVHGSELSAVEIARSVIEKLKEGNQPYYNVVVVPALFPDNIARALAFPAKIGNQENIGRYTHNNAVDPNRQMPTLGTVLKGNKDHLGRVIETENQLLLKLINELKPDRIINLHAIRNINSAGFYADPRTDHSGCAFGFGSDSSLAIDMAKFVHRSGGNVEGNKLASLANAKYPKDPQIVAEGCFQPRSINGSYLPNKRGCGVSLGSWATTAIEDIYYPENNRDAIRLITVEFPGYKRPVDYKDPALQRQCAFEIDLYAKAIVNVFLEDHYTEKLGPLQYTSVNK